MQFVVQGWTSTLDVYSVLKKSVSLAKEKLIL